MSNNLGSLGLILTLASIVTPAGAIAQEEGKEYTIVNFQSGRLLDALEVEQAANAEGVACYNRDIPSLERFQDHPNGKCRL